MARSDLLHLMAVPIIWLWLDMIVIITHNIYTTIVIVTY